MKTFIFISILFFNSSSFGQIYSNINKEELISELQKWEYKGNDMSFSFWIPTSYWRLTLDGNTQIPQETIKLIESVFENYVFVCAADIQVNVNGIMTFTADSILRKTISIMDIEGKTYYPLPSAQISSDTKTIIEGIKPMFAQMLGQMGAGMHLYLFEIKDKKNNNIINEMEEGGFTINHSNHEFTWTLPLVSMLPPKYCPIDNEKMKGNWNFCPIHGEKLKK